jgi:hypothetical protein
MSGLLLAGCTAKSTQPMKDTNSEADFPQEKVFGAIVEESKKNDHTVVDGWYYGEEPRIFKSAYYKLTPEQKATFALAYQEWLNQCGQNMVADWTSYVPYTKRSLWARKWFTEHHPEFSKETSKMKVVWIHEALLDGSELRWRALEQLARGQVQGQAELAHDAEQKLVFKYAESEGQEGSLSTQPML